MKISKKMKISLMSLCSLFLLSAPLISMPLISKLNSKFNSPVQSTLNEVDTILNKVYDSSNSLLETISNELGPIVIKDKTIVNYDWYYNDYWTIDLTKYSNSTTVVDWEFLQNYNLLFAITDTSHLIKINTLTGEVLADSSRVVSAIPAGSNKLGFISYDLELYVWNSFTSNGHISQVDRNILKVSPNSGNFVQCFNTSIINSLKLDVGYNLVVTTTNAISSSTSSITAIQLSFYTDSFRLFTSTSGGIVPNINLTIPATQYKSIYSNLFYRESSKSYIVIIGNKFFEIILNKQDMTKTTIIEFNNALPPTTNINFNKINSAFITASDYIYIKSDNDSNIYWIEPDSLNIKLFINLAVANYNNNEILNIAKDLNNKLQIYGVVSVDSQMNNDFLDFAVFLSDPLSEVVGGILNGVVLEPFSASKPVVLVRNSASFFVSVPSSITSNSFESKNADPLLASNVHLIANDILGTLTLKATLARRVWYQSTGILKNTTIFNEVYNLVTAPSKFVFADQAVFNNISQGYFVNRTPSQIDESDFNTFVNQVLPTSSATPGTFNNVTKLFIITGRDDVMGIIKVKAIVSYVNRYNNLVSFIVPEKSYQVKIAAGSSYVFEFVAEDSIEISDFKKFLPSLIDPTNKVQLEKFILKEQSYIPSRRVITLNPDDNAGALTVNVYYNGLDPSINANYSKVYGGFVSNSSASIEFKGDNEISPNPGLDPNVKNITSIIGYESYKDMVSTSVMPENLNLTYNFSVLANMNFVPKISILPLTNLETELGAVTIELDFSFVPEAPGKKLPSLYKDLFGLTNYKISQQYLGFLPIGSTFGVSLSSYKSRNIQELFQLYSVGSTIPNDILLSTLVLKGYKINEVKINGYIWENETLKFNIIAQSEVYTSVKKNYSFKINWSIFFASERQKNLVIGLSVAIVGVAIILLLIIIYILRKNKIRRLLK